MSNNKIDINQRIPLATLQAALESYLDDSYTNEYVLEQLRIVYKGENRLKKALRIVNKIIFNSPEIEFINSNKELLKSAIKIKADRNIILISLLNISYPFSYQVLNNFAKIFSVQNIVNTDTIKKNISKTYGGNRATENGIYSVVPMFLEAEIFTRPKQGLYTFEKPIRLNTELAKTFFSKSYIHNNTLNTYELNEHQEPYFLFID
ncbi:MAG: hypothetical protein LAT51_13580 [Flavobacteriaceae bacterium]|nr:hypothetical protein [Flavobacteriaceae bacterium]